MTNFLLVDAPNFVLLLSTREAQGPASFGPPIHLNPVFNELVAQMAFSSSVDELACPVTFDGRSIVLMRKVLAQYGFDLPPLTVGELFGLFAYCDALDALSGIGVFARQQRRRWRQMSDGLRSGHRTPGQRALAMYARGDLPGLRALHRAQGTMAELGRACEEGQ